MPPLIHPSPSIIAIDIPDRQQVRSVESAINLILSEEEGSHLTWIGGSWYAVSRPVSKQLMTGLGADEVDVGLRRISGVRNVSRMPAHDVVRAYSERVPTPGSAQVTLLDLQAQWNLQMVRAPEAWELFDGGLAGAAWHHVRVGHLDTGYTRHEVLGFGDTGGSDFVRAQEGINFFDESGGLPMDPLNPHGTPGHGTRTMSVLAGHAPGKMFGVAPRVTVIPYRVTDFVVIDTLWNRNPLDLAMDHAVLNTGCQVINISLGDPCFPPSRVGRTIDRAYEQGVIVVAAAGNITSEVTYPGRYARTIAVGGVTKNGRPWSGGSRGPRVDISAPADDIYRATVTKADGGATYGYGDGGDGTSYAATHVSAAAALWLAFRGNDLRQYIEGWQIVEAFRTVLKGSARVRPGWNDRLFGAGILDIRALLDERLPDPGDLAKETDRAENDIF